VRAVGEAAERFAEDGLRPMRAVRFAAQLGYDLAPSTRRAIPSALPVVAKVAIERISEELSRLVVAPDASRAIFLMRATRLLETVLPSFAALPVQVQDHAARVLAHLPSDGALRFAGLLHPLGADAAGKVMEGLRQPRRVSDEVVALIRVHACRLGTHGPVLPPTPVEIRRWLSRAGPDRAGELLALAEAEAAAAPTRDAPVARDELRDLRATLAQIARDRPPLTPQELAVDGRRAMEVLGAPPGPHVGEAIRHLLDRVLEDPELNRPEVLEDELRRWWAERARRG
jgi:tRNA nucleotidyltransferase (CCA-adding enzyme)